MTAYFPYSQIISEICNKIEKTINRHAYTGDWQVADSKPNESRKTSLTAISELYY